MYLSLLIVSWWNLRGSLVIYPKEPKTLIQKYISPPMFTAALFTIAKIWKHPKCPSIDE